MADTLPQDPLSFEAQLAELLKVVAEHQAAPRQDQAIDRAGAAPKPRYAHRAEAGYGRMPYVPPLEIGAPNALAGDGADPVLDMAQRSGRAERFRNTFGVEHDDPNMTSKAIGSLFAHGTDAPQVQALAVLPFMKYPRAAAAVGGALAGMWPGSAGSSGDDAVTQLQQELKNSGYYKGPIDGKMGPGTQDAKARFEADRQARELQAIERQKAEAASRGAEAEMAKAEAARKKVEADIEAAARTAAERKTGEERYKQMEDDVHPLRRAWREYGPTAAYVVGGALGAKMRTGNAAAGNLASAERAAQATQGIAGAPGGGVPVGANDLASRFPPVNEFWRRGGAAETPFLAAPGTRAGVQSNANAPQANALFPQGGQFTGQDAKYMGAFGADVVLGMWGQDWANKELAAANEAAARDPSEVNLRRLQTAKDLATAAKFGTNLGYGLGAGYGIMSAKGGRETTVPSTATAESERAAIDQFLRTANNPKGGMKAPQPPVPSPPTSPGSAPSTGNLTGPSTATQGRPRAQTQEQGQSSQSSQSLPDHLKPAPEANSPVAREKATGHWAPMPKDSAPQKKGNGSVNPAEEYLTKDPESKLLKGSDARGLFNRLWG